MSLAKRGRDLPLDHCADCALSMSQGVFNYSKSADTFENQIVSFVRSVGINITVTSRLRTCCEQSKLYRAGQTPAPPTTSQHEFGFAFDLVPTAGYAQYGASFKETLAWLVALGRFYGADGLAEPTHAHIQVYSSAAWNKFIAGRDIAVSIPW